MTEVVYAIGDIHGYSDQLDRVLGLIDADGGTNCPIVFLGDYVDRGPHSRHVIETLVQGQRSGRNWILLKGNHDRMFEWFLETPPRHDPHLLVGLHWFHERLGGIETLSSYGIDVQRQMRLSDVHEMALSKVPNAHIEFLKGLKLSHRIGDLFFVHAGVRPGVALDRQVEDDLVWIRKEFHASRSLFGALIVHGHTPVDQATHYGNRVNLDTGAGFGRDLSVAVFEQGQVWKLTDRGRVPLKMDLEQGV